MIFLYIKFDIYLKFNKHTYKLYAFNSNILTIICFTMNHQSQTHT